MNSEKKCHLDIDIGASSGGHIIAWRECGEIKTDEVYRFPNGTKNKNGHLVWDVDALLKHVVRGIKAAFRKHPQIESLAITTWGYDYVLITDNGELLPCLAYRDHRTETVIDEVHRRVPFSEMYAHTGISFQPFNTVYQLYEDAKRKRLSMATDFLMMPEYIAYKLTGKKVKNYANATETGLIHAETGVWDTSIIEALALPEKLFPELHSPGETVGTLLEKIASEVGGNCKVVLCATHGKLPL